MSLSWVPNKAEGTAKTTVDFHYYTSPRTRKYYQHYDGAGAALEAADRFVERAPLRTQKIIISSEVVHEPAKQRVMVYITEKL